MSFGLRFSVELVHPAVVKVITILYCKPGVLLDVVVVLDWLVVDDVVFAALPVVDAPLVHLQATLPIA